MTTTGSDRTVTLPSGDDLPRVGFGTWDLRDDTARTAVTAALDAGYGHIDTAEGYKNERAVGEALAEYPREEVFLTSKVTPSNLYYDNLIDACTASLDRLGTSYLDLYLIHWPNPAVSLRESLYAMANLHDQGLVRNIGVSNFDVYWLRNAQRITDIPLAVNQIEFHPWYPQPETVLYCHENDIVVTGAAPLARTKLFEDPVIQELADTYGKTPAQVVLRWELQQGVVPLPKSSSPAHIRENHEVFDWELDPADADRTNGFDREEKVYNIDWDDPVYGIPE